jgi:regulator of RNase E activity RraA
LFYLSIAATLVQSLSERENVMRATNDEIAILRQFDTPTICNGLEVIDAASKDGGYTRSPMVMAPKHLEMPEGARAICGRAKTLTMRSLEGHGRTAEDHAARRADCYDYVADADSPVVLVVEDTDDHPIGAYWGEVHTALHRALGCLGVVTNGTVRDLDDLDAEFMVVAGGVTPTHANGHCTTFGQGATVFGMTVADGDVIHADAHGAVIVPEAAVAALPDAIAGVQAKEEKILSLTRADSMDLAALREALKG